METMLPWMSGWMKLLGGLPCASPLSMVAVYLTGVTMEAYLIDGCFTALSHI
jgi:hypothetical protein